MLPGGRLGWHHVAGGLIGLAGTAMIVTGGESVSFNPAYLTGYLAAMMCALTWSLYSVLSRSFGKVATDVVVGFCLVTAMLSFLCHLVLEETVWPQSSSQWLAIAALGAGPVGAAFYTWDFGVKHGDIKILGAASYMAPLLSTLFLIAAGMAEPNWTIAIACLAITGGAALAAKDMLFRRAPR